VFSGTYGLAAQLLYGKRYRGSFASVVVVSLKALAQRLSAFCFDQLAKVLTKELLMLGSK
jgi:hypothetical protein